MKTTTRIILLSVAILGLPLASSIAQPPPLINYQGRLVDGTNLVSGVVNMRFRLHDDPAGGSLLFESTNLVTVVDGLYATVIGENTVSGTLTDALANPAVWLELEVDGTTLSPRERILSAGYALMADSVKSEGVTEAMIVNEAVTAGKVDAATFNQTFWRAGGNAGTTPGTNYLGTSDDQPLELHVNGARVLRLEPDASSPRIVGGHPANTAVGEGSTVGGGGDSSNPNSAYTYATVSGGLGNIALGTVATVGGGLNNTASGSSSTVGGGWDNTASDYAATVGGGLNNTASGLFSTVDGGRNNTASALYSTVGGGGGNTASGDSATIPGGRLNVATNYAFAAGHRAKANHDGAFVWGDSTNADFESETDDEFAVRASGGMRVVGGAITAEEGVKKVYKSGASAQPATPLAYGRVTATGTLGGGTENIESVNWNASSSQYEITIRGVNYNLASYSTVVTTSGGWPRVFRTGSSMSGMLLIMAYNLDGDAAQGSFSFVVHGPF